MARFFCGGNRGQTANFDRMQKANFELAAAASAGGEAGAGTLRKDRGFHQGRVVSLAAAVWQVQGQARSGGAG